MICVDFARYRRLREFFCVCAMVALILDAQLVWLVIQVATGSSPFPIISIALIAAVYGLQVCHLCC